MTPALLTPQPGQDVQQPPAAVGQPPQDPSAMSQIGALLGQPSVPALPQQSPDQQLSPAMQRLVQELEKSRQRSEQNRQALLREMQPGSVQQYLPKATAANILQDGLYNSVRSMMAMRMGAAPPEPVQSQRLQRALEFQQLRMRGLGEADTNEKNYAATLMGQLGQQRQLETANQLNAIRQQRADTDRQREIDTAFNNSLRLAMTDERLKNGWKVMGAAMPGSVAASIAPIDFYGNLVNTQPGYDYVQVRNDAGQLKLLPSFIESLLPKDTTKTNTSVKDVNGVPTAVTTTDTSSTAPRLPSPAVNPPVKPPAPPPRPVAGTASAGVTSVAPGTRLTPIGQADPQKVAYWTAAVAGDFSNWKAIQSDKVTARAVQNNLANLGMSVDFLGAQEHDVAAFARTAHQHVGELLGMIDKLDKAGQLGPLADHWQDFLNGKLGVGDPQFDKMRVYAKMLTSAAARIHGGARGGGSPQMLAYMNTLESPSMSPDVLRASISALDGWITGYAGFGAPKSGVRGAPQNAPLTPASGNPSAKPTLFGRPLQ